MIADEVQSGIGRAGEWFLSHAEGIRPDVITLAKGLAGGMPLGALIVEPDFVEVFAAGDHGTTFGGNPVSCAAALAVIAEIEAADLLQHVRETGEWLTQQILELPNPEIVGVRGRGLWLAIELNADIASAFTVEAQSHGFLVNAVKPNAIRLAPPLIITRAELQTFIDAIPSILKGIQNV
jgi:acetylornithine aminotransferase